MLETKTETKTETMDKKGRFSYVPETKQEALNELLGGVSKDLEELEDKNAVKIEIYGRMNEIEVVPELKTLHLFNHYLEFDQECLERTKKIYKRLQEDISIDKFMNSYKQKPDYNGNRDRLIDRFKMEHTLDEDFNHVADIYDTKYLILTTSRSRYSGNWTNPVCMKVKDIGSYIMAQDRVFASCDCQNYDLESAGLHWRGFDDGRITEEDFLIDNNTEDSWIDNNILIHKDCGDRVEFYPHFV